MKRTFSYIIMLLICSFLFTPCVPVGASNIVGIVVSTNIAAFVNLQPIRSYNINGYTHVIVEDLRDYGFDIIWDENERSLNITCNYGMAKPAMSVDDINVKKTDISAGAKVYDVYSTDIKTYMDGELVDAYNVDGSTLIKMRDLEKYGYVKWDESIREASVDVLSKHLDWLFENAANKVEITVSDTQSYVGQVLNNLPHGIGKLTEAIASQTDNSIQAKVSSEKAYFGFFEAGKKNGIIIESGHLTQAGYPYRAAGVVHTIYTQYCNYENDMPIGYFVSNSSYGSVYSGGKYIKTEGYYADGKLNGFGRKWEKFEEYLFNYKIWEQGEYIDGEIQDRYEAAEYNDIPYVYIYGRRYWGGVAIKEDGSLWYLVENRPDIPKPFYIADNIKKAIINDSTQNSLGIIFAITNDDILSVYSVPNGVGSISEKIADIATDVLDITSNHYVTKSGDLYKVDKEYQKTHLASNVRSAEVHYGNQEVWNGSYITNDDKLYLWGFNYLYQIGEQYPNPVEEPTFYMDNVKTAHIDTPYAVIKNDDTLWIWGSLDHLGITREEINVPFGNPSTNPIFTDLHTKQPQYIMDNVKQFAGDLPLSALQNDGTLWSWSRTEFGPSTKYTESDLRVKMMDDVNSVSYRYVIKNDGTLWKIRGFHFENDPDSADYTPIQITGNYKPIKVRF